MPVHKVKGGYKWGTHGKVYKTRAGAERQARAIYASGYRKDATDRPRRRIQAGKLRVPAVVENRYVLSLRRILAQAHQEFMRVLRQRSDAYHEHTGTLDLAQALIKVAIVKPVSEAFLRMKDGVIKANRLALQPISHTDQRLGGLIDKFRENNIRLIQKAVDTQANDIRRVLDENIGVSIDDLADLLEQRASVSGSRAELIARDQTLKLSGQVNQTRQENAGVTQYIWNTSHDERVRDEHAALDGQTFDWSSPPEPGHPGEDIQCRCVALPVL